MRNQVVFIGEENRINNELYQLLNWRFRVTQYSDVTCLSLDGLSATDITLVVVSMFGDKINYGELFEGLTGKCANIPVVTISTKTESDAYEKFYENGQFHRILRPITGKKIIEICRSVIGGTVYAEEEEVETVQESTEKKHILVVDDNALVLRNIKGGLEEKYSIAVAPSGFHAFVSIGRKMPDLILLDYEMPEMNGKEVMEKLQADEELRDIPIVFLTSVDSREIVMELLALKPAGYILKPADAQILQRRIEEIIGK